MKQIRIQAIMVIIVAFFNTVSAQIYTGIVKSEDSVPLARVSIFVDGNLITTTNEEGEFTLPNTLIIPVKLALDHPDYESTTIIFKKDGQIIYLKKSIPTEELNSILVNVEKEKIQSIITPTVTVGSADISQQSPVDVVAAINQKPGIFIQSGAINTNRIVIRGVGSRTLYGTNKIKAYFNGIPITSGVGETAIDIYDPENIKSIEIIKGPKATAYGTNLGGTLLLTSKTPDSQGLSIRNNTTIGSFGLFKNSMSSDFSQNKLNLHLTYDHLEFDGFRENGNYNRNSVMLTSSYRFNENTELSLLINHSDYTAQIPSSIGKTAFEENPSQAAFTWQQAQGFEADNQTLVGISLKHQFATDFKNTTSFFYSYTDHYEPRPFNILDEYTNVFGVRFVFDKTFNFLTRKAQWSFGAELYKDEYNWQTIENLYEENNGNGSLQGMPLSKNEEYRQQLNVFSSLTLPIFEKVTMQMGVNFNKTKYEFQDEFQTDAINSSLSRNFDVVVAPNFNLLYQYAPAHSMYANVSYGFNYPSLEETLTPEGVVNPDINPERGYNYEFGFESSFFKRKLNVLTSIYMLDIKDLLVAQRVGDDQYIGRNAGRTLHKGLELSSNYRLTFNQFLSVSPYVNLTLNWHKFKDFISDDNDFSSNDLTGVPDVTVSSGIAVQYKNFTLYNTHLYVGAIPMNDANTLYSNPYNLINSKLVYTTDVIKNISLRLHFGVNNLFDSNYASSILINAVGFGSSEPRYYYPGNPRNVYGGIFSSIFFVRRHSKPSTTLVIPNFPKDIPASLFPIPHLLFVVGILLFTVASIPVEPSPHLVEASSHRVEPHSHSVEPSSNVVEAHSHPVEPSSDPVEASSNVVEAHSNRVEPCSHSV